MLASLTNPKHVLQSELMQVCGLWHLETSLLPIPACAAVDGVGDVRADRWEVQCSVCHVQEGAVIQCNSGHCATAFHPLCARNNGQYLTAREGSAGRIVHRAYCTPHSSAQRSKDMEGLQEVLLPEELA